MLAWSFLILKQGVHPANRHDDTDFSNDPSRAAFAGTSMEALGACICFKSDWMEWGKVGFRSWSHLIHPCAICKCTSATLQACGGVSRDSFPFPLKTFDDYDSACRNCEIQLELTTEQWGSIRASLLFAGKGRVLGVAFPALKLRKGDTLMPTQSLLDFGEGFDTANPGIVTFWRSDKTSAVKFRCPFFREEIGTEPDRILGPDWLHSFSLGILPWWNGWVFWELVGADVWLVRRQGQDLVTQSLARMKGELTKWYAAEGRKGHHWTRVQDIKIGMLGNNDRRHLKFYASEANGFLHFTRTFLDRYGHVLGARLEQARKCQSYLADLHVLFRKHPLRMPTGDAELMCISVNLVIRAISRTDDPPVPKTPHVSPLCVFGVSCSFTLFMGMLDR